MITLTLFNTLPHDHLTFVLIHSPSITEMRHRPLGDDLFTVSDGEEMERREEGRRRRRRKEREMEDGGPIEIYENLEWIKMNHKTK